MINDAVNKVIESLGEEKDKIVSFLNERMQSVVFPEHESVESQESKEEKRNKTPLLIASGGALGLMADIYTKTKWLSALGICLVAIGCILFFWHRKRTHPQPQTNEIEYSELSSMIYKTLESVHSHITKEWDCYLGQQNSMLKSVIQSTIEDEDKENELLDKTTHRSQIRFSMMDANFKLLTSSKSEDVNAIKNTTLSLIDNYIAAIEEAYQEQLSIYSSMTE